MRKQDDPPEFESASYGLNSMYRKIMLDHNVRDALQCNLKIPKGIVIPKRGGVARGKCCFSAGSKQIPRR